MFLKNKKIYIAGCGGMLGEAFYNHFKVSNNLLCTDISVSDDWLSYMDMRDKDKYFQDVLKYDPDYLFHLGAITNLEECEEDQNNAYLTNLIAVENACAISNHFNIPILFISTAGIFDGKKEEYDDWDQPNPLGIYAKTKYLAENHVQSICNKFIICRAGWMMGGGEKKDKKFVNKIISQIKSGKKILNIVNDKFGTPTYTYDFAKNADLIISKGLFGLFNLVCEGLTSREEVAKEILEILNLEKEIKINLVKSEFFKKDYYAPRPPSERLINKKLNLRKLNIMRNWKDCLKEYIVKDYNENE